jgi:hypothetical protein
MFNKKAQIGETMTWVIATIVIVIILGLSIFVVSFDVFKKSKKFDLNKESDLLATKSITNFLMSNLDLIKDSTRNNDCALLEEKMEIFLDILPKSSIKGWNFQSYLNKNQRCEKKSYIVLGWKDYYSTFFKFKENSDEIMLRFWEDHQ